MATSKTKPGKKAPAHKKKTTAKKAAAKKTAVTRKKTAAKKKAAKKPTPVTPAERHLMIQEAAYYIAEARGFAPDAGMTDWLIAEEQIDSLLSKQ